MTALRPALRAATFAALLVAADPAEAAKKTGAQRSQLHSEQRALQQRLARVKREVAAAETARTEAADALRDSEQAISDVNRRLRELAADRRRVQREIDALAEHDRAVQSQRGNEQRGLSQALRSRQMLARASAWQRLIEGANPGELPRELAYLDHIGRTHGRTLAELRRRGDELAESRAQAAAKHTELAALAEDEQKVQAELVRQQAARSRALERVSRQLAGQRRTLAALQRDEKRLASLIDQLQRALAAPARSKPGTPPPAVEVPADTAFARMRGKLVLPVRGRITARFGSPRPTEAQVDAPTWKGLFISAAAGAEVHAVAAGRVVFADWLRGFGNLLVIDHGEGFLSVYGNNEALLANVGEQVGAAEAIATVGASGGAAQPGLYFELRFRGKPLDPQQWAQAR